MNRILGVGAVLAALLVPAGAATAANPPCDATVTHSVTLTADMTCPASNGLNVGANGVSINLNGHTINGVNGTHYGISAPGYSGVRVSGGTVENFSYQIYFNSASNSNVSRVTLLSMPSSSAGLFSDFGSNDLFERISARG